jgi:trigger factor
MRTTVTELPESRVRIAVDVDADAVEKRVERTARQLGREMRVPGFRRGKVPPALVMQRVGREAVVEQAVREGLPEWYERALLEAGVTAIGDPKLDLAELPAAGEELQFSIEVGVRPKAKLGEYRGLEVGRTDAEVPDEAIAAELDRLREAMASVSPVERAAAEGDLVVIDYDGTVDDESFEGGTARDLMVELSDESLLREMREALTGASAGDELEVEVDFPEDHRPAELSGKHGKFVVRVKEVREKRLPELDDDFAAEASEFDTLEELRGEIAKRLSEALERRSEADFREAAVDAVAAGTEVDLPPELVAARAEEMLDRFLHRLSHQGVDPDAFLRLQDGGREGMLGRLREDAERNLRREAALAAIADAEGFEVTDDDMLTALGPGEAEQDPATLLRRLRETGRDSLLRDELRVRKAADLVASEAKPIPLERAAARDALWTPEKEREGEAAGLWTPGSE